MDETKNNCGTGDTGDTVDTGRGGNTKTPRIRARRWCYTLNNYTPDELAQLHREFDTGIHVVGKEVGESGTPHLQGYVEFKNARGLSALKRINSRIHWEKARGNRDQNVEYCSKEGDAQSTIPLPREKRILARYDSVEWRPWQRELLDLVATAPDERTIHWYWEPAGNVGKSFICKYLALRHDAIIAEGKKADIFNQVKTWLDAHEDTQEDPKLVLIDVPRTSLDYVSYAAIEALKNGLMYSGKYEGGRCIIESPHVVVFANEEPRYEKMSQDRWRVTRIQ